MKQHFLLLFFFVGTFVSSVEYHGNRQYWTTVDDQGNTFVALHILEESVNILFPKDKNFSQIASDMKLYSPTGNEKCQDTANTLRFTLLFDSQNHIRGEIILDADRKVMSYMYEQCGDTERRDDYATEAIEDIQQNLEADGRTCFRNRDPFHPYESDDTKNVMELKRTRHEFGCQVFMILPEYMQMEDAELPLYNTIELNATFAGHDEKFWWKSKNDCMLPSDVSFDSSKNIFINILKSIKGSPYFFRIGSGQPIPTFNFTFGANCNGAKFEMFLNLKPECFVNVSLTDTGFTISTKDSENNAFKGSLSSMVFGDKYVFVRVNSPLNIQSFKVCDDLSNIFDVPPDQFVLQVSPKEIANRCEKAQVVLLNSDVVNGTEVLIDRSKIKEIIENSTTTENSTFLVTTSEAAKSGGFEWYWYLIIGILILGILAAIIILVFCIRRRRQKTKKSKMPVKSVGDEEVGRRTITTKTAVSTEKVSKELKPKVSDGKKVDKKKQKKVKKEATKQNDKLSKEKLAKIQSVQTPKPLPPTPIQPSGEKVVQPLPVQKPMHQLPPPLPVIPGKPLRNLKYRSMYGEDKRTKLDEPFDYHENESEEFKASIIPAEFPRPDLRIYDNFWDCLGQILKTTMFCRVFADNFFDGNSNVYFMFRDLVAESEKYAPLRSLSNRILEQCEDHSQKTPAPILGKDGKKRVKSDWCYCLRVFVLSYDPLTVEIHCRGPWPHFMFKIFDCSKCRQLFEELEKNEWKDSPVACDESWDQFICRVKRTPVNFHQFLTFYGGFGALEPENPNDIYNIFIFRGEWNSDNLRDCARGCTILDDKSHFNECELETSLQKSPSLSK